MRLSNKGFSLYTVISIVALAALLFILILPRCFNLKEKENTEQCIKNMKLIQAAVKDYMVDRNEDFNGDLLDLQRTGFLKKTYECPENGVGDKYQATGKIIVNEFGVKKYKVTVICPNHEPRAGHHGFKDHEIPDME